MVANEWINVNIGQDATLKARIGWQGLTVNEYRATGDYYLVTGTDFENGLVNWDTCHYVDKYRYTQDRNIQLKNGDILITKDGTIGKVGYVENLKLPATLNSGVFVVRPKHEDFDSKYFYYIFTSEIFDEFLTKLVAGSTINHLYQKDFVHFEFQVPPKQEQKAIATALSDVDGLITSLESLIAKKQNIKTATMQQLLTGKKRLDGFSGEWVEKKLGEYVSIASGDSPSKFDFYNKGLPYYKVEQLNYSAKYLAENTPYFINDTSKKVFAKSVIFPKRGAAIFLNKIRLLKSDAFFDTNLMALTTNDKLSYEFLFYVLSYIGLEHVADTTSVPQINNKHINPFVIPFPDIKEQIAIATILSDIDSEIEVLKIKLSKVKVIKEGMMQELLTGKTRLI